MIVVELDKSKETKETIQFIGKKFNYHGQLDNFKTSNPFKGKPITELAQVVTLSHGSEHSLGDFDSADEFVDRFVSNFEKAGFTEGDKLKVDHLYLIGCEVGKVNRDGTSLAQTIANKLAEKGFHKLTVHAVSVPQHYPQQTGDLVVEIVTDPGEGGRAANRLIERAQQEGAKVKKIQFEGQLAASIGKKPFLNAKDPIDVLNYETNRFNPGETPQRRQARLQDHAATREHAQACSIIQRRKQKLEEEISEGKNAADKQAKVRALDYILKRLQNAYPEQWQDIIQARLDDVEKGTTKDILKDLAKKKFADAEKKVPQSSRQPSPVKQGNGPTIVAPLEAVITSPFSAPETANTPSLRSDSPLRPPSFHRPSSPEHERLLAAETSKEIELKQPDKPFTLVQIIKARDEIQHYKEQLDRDIRQRQSSNFSFFKPTSIKHYKMVTLQKLEDDISAITASFNQRSANEQSARFYTLIHKAINDDKLTYGVFSSRTENLLQNILNHQPERGIQPPREISEERGFSLFRWIGSLLP